MAESFRPTTKERELGTKLGEVTGVAKHFLRQFYLREFIDTFGADEEERSHTMHVEPIRQILADIKVFGPALYEDNPDGIIGILISEDKLSLSNETTGFSVSVNVNYPEYRTAEYDGDGSEHVFTQVAIDLPERQEPTYIQQRAINYASELKGDFMKDYQASIGIYLHALHEGRHIINPHRIPSDPSE